MSDVKRLSRVDDSEIEDIARAMIDRHRGGAACAAAGRVNDMIDEGDDDGRDVWARVVRAIHQRQRGPDPRPHRGYRRGI